MTTDEFMKIREATNLDSDSLIGYHCPNEYGYEENNPPMDLWNPCDMVSDILYCALCWGRATKKDE